MTPAARISAGIEVLDKILAGDRAEAAIKRWGRENRYAGSKDRAAVRDMVFDALRRKMSSISIGGQPTGRAWAMGWLFSQGLDLDQYFTGEKYAPEVLTELERDHIDQHGFDNVPVYDTLDIPEWLWPIWEYDLGDKAISTASALQNRAPVFLRVNLLKTDRDSVQMILENENITTEKHPEVETALRVVEGARKIATCKAYLTGLVELQDASSQASILHLPRSMDSKILDYCAGGGGKSLALAAWTGAPIVAHDKYPQRMRDLPNRIERAGANITISHSVKEQFETVFCDAPCSGSGTWRRDPEGKWALDSEKLENLVAIQNNILDAAQNHVLPHGRLIYATCSVLWRENLGQIESFCTNNNQWAIETARQFFPADHGDGFFVASLAKK